MNYNDKINKKDNVMVNFNDNNLNNQIDRNSNRITNNKNFNCIGILTLEDIIE